MSKSRSTKKASEIIAEECRGSVHREFPSQWLEKTLADIEHSARQGDRSARKALKLLNDPRFKKDAE
ncbi:MAG TPA: hypothetical protein VEL76_07750 [Gemmataceae bacterium]|nr:hypothetical protein [Gemmataceae bacterium]